MKRLIRWYVEWKESKKKDPTIESIKEEIDNLKKLIDKGVK